MTKMVHRVVAIAAAGLFLITSVGFSIMVVWQMHKDSQTNKTTTANTSTNNTEGKLEGTKLSGFTPIAKIDNLQKIDQKEGTGTEVKAGETVTAHYTGAVAATGVIFQSSHDSGNPATFPLSNVIPGWQEGVPGMKVGGTRRLLIPAEKAYGATPPQGSNIPPNADLVFDIELVKIGE